mgnify:CR=1 FL=1
MLIVLLQLPPVQAFIGSQAASALKDKFGTEVNIGKVNLGFLNRIIIDDVMMKDQQGDSMIYASRISAKIDLLPLKEGKISVNTPIAQGLLGKKVGDVAEITVPQGKIALEVVNISI